MNIIKLGSELIFKYLVVWDYVFEIYSFIYFLYENLFLDVWYYVGVSTFFRVVYG